MAYRKVKWVSVRPDRHGKMRSRFRRKGFTAYLHADYGTEQWWTEYHALCSGETQARAVLEATPGTISGLISLYYRSPDFLSLSDSTKGNYRYVTERFRVEHGHRLTTEMQRKHVHSIIAARASTPAAANRLLSIITILMKLAVELGMRGDNPAKGVRKFKLKSPGHHSWTSSEIAQYEKTHVPGTQARLALCLLLYLAQRCSDVVKLGRQHIKDGMINVNQQKTGMELWLPILPQLRAEIERTSGMTFLVNSIGRPYSARTFGRAMRKWCDAAGLMGCSAHGLRKAAAARMAEVGCTEREIMAITGHVTSQEVGRYTRAANQYDLAKKAGKKLSNLSDRLDK